MRILRVVAWIAAAAAIGGCASRPVNERITQVDPKSGYRPYLLIPKRKNNDLHTLFVMSFSGGGTRAAAFCYGVLEGLRRTEIVMNGQRRRLIDEVDVAFDAIRDPKEREYFMNLPTSFVLTAEQVDRLREVAGRLLRASPDYQALVREMGGTPAK